MPIFKATPDIRFSGFTDDWKQLKLGDILSCHQFRTYIADPKANGAYEVIQQGDQPVVGFANGNPYENYQPVTLFGDHTVSLYKPANPFFVATDGLKILSADGFEGDFLFTLLEKYKPVSQGYKRHFRILANENAWATYNANEQLVVGLFFITINNLITLHQREYDKTVNVKKAMLEKMFPKDGADRPEIRFAGFTGAWEQRKLGELYLERNDRGNDSLKILSVSIHHGVSNDELDENALGKKVRRSEDKSLYKRVYSGDLVFNMMRAWQGAIGVVKAEGMVSPAYITAIPNEQVFPLFMDCCLQRNEIITQINNLSYGVTDFRKRLYWDSFIRVVCRIPSVPEQAKITSFFTGLDNLIALHQRELAKLQNIKKSLLEKMFV